MKLTGSQLVAEILLEHGVDTVFGYPGGTALNLYDTLYEYRDKIRHIRIFQSNGENRRRLCYQRPRSNKPCNGNRHSIYGQHSYDRHYS